MRKTNKVFKQLVFMVLLTAFLFMGLQANFVDKRKIDKLVYSYYDKDQFTGTVLVSRGTSGHIIYELALGKANREWNVDNTMKTKMLIGSNTKQFTAMLVMQEVQNGRIDLDRVISVYLPEYNGEGKDTVTIDKLLSMQSWIPNYTTLEKYQHLPGYTDNASYPLSYSIDDFINRYCSDALKPPPYIYRDGTVTCLGDYEYSNSNYYILGEILEKVTRKSYSDLLQERIFDKLEMNDSGYYTNEAILNQMASGYTNFYDENNNISSTTRGRYIDVSNMYTTGGIYSTALDMNKWYSSLYTDQLLTYSNLQKMMDRHILICPNDAEFYEITPLFYGYGFQVGKMQVGSRTLNVVLHGGSVPGSFRSFHIRVLDDRYTVIVISNTYNDDATYQGIPPAYDIAVNIVRILYGEKPMSLSASIAKQMKFDW